MIIMEEMNFVDFQFEFDGDLSIQTKSYIHTLEIKSKVDVYMSVLESFQENEVGWALIPERKVYIRPTKELKEFELRLVHELTHIALADEGYRLIRCYEGDTLCSSFANLLHHLVLYPRLIACGYLLEEDTHMVMAKLVENLNGYKDVSLNYGAKGTAYAVIQVINDLIRIDSSGKEDYLLAANISIPELLPLAQCILTQVGEINPSVEDYEKYKTILEKELGLDSEFSWLE